MSETNSAKIEHDALPGAVPLADTTRSMQTGKTGTVTSPCILNGMPGSNNLKTITVSRVSATSPAVSGTYTPPHGSVAGSANVKLNPTRWTNFVSSCKASFTASITHHADNQIFAFEPSSSRALMAALHDIEHHVQRAGEHTQKGNELLAALLDEIRGLRRDLKGPRDKVDPEPTINEVPASRTWFVRRLRDLLFKHQSER